MALQDTYLTALDRFREIAGDVELDSSLVERATDHHAKVAAFQVLIPLVGSFNAGKTSLVNAWLQRADDAGLPTDIVPQTALATEIRFAGADAEEQIELYGDDDRLLRRVDLAEFGRVEKESLTTGAAAAAYARAVLRPPRQGDGAGHDWKVLVDMPGLDSGLRTHNLAIQRYLPLGSYFILVVDVEHGALRSTEIEQLREFLELDVEFVVLVNKIDKKWDTATEVVDYIRQQAHKALGKSVAVFPVSAHEGDVVPFRRVIDAVDFDGPLCNFWRTHILHLFDDAVGSLQTRYSALNVSIADRERAVAGLEEQKQALQAKLRDDKQKVRERYSDRAVDRIVEGARDAIRSHAGPLAQTLQSGGQQAFDYELNEVVRRTLNRLVDKERRTTLGQITDRLETDLSALDAQHEEFLRAGSSPSALETTAGFAGRISHAAQASAQAFGEAKKRAAGATTMYTAVTGVLAAATSIVAPWLEVLIIALPAIFNWIRGKMEAQQREQRMQEQIRQLQTQIASVIAPRVASELRDRVSDDYASATRDLIAGLQAHVTSKVEGIQADIDRSRAEVEEQQRDVEQRKEQLRAAIGRMSEARKPVAEAK